MKPEEKIKVMALKKSVPALSWLLLGLAVLAVLIGLSSCAAAPAPAAEALAREVSVAQAGELRDQGAFVLDVRTQEEWNQFHIPDSTLVPLDQLQSRLSEVPKDKDVVVVCRSGNRSASGRDLLLQAGYPNVTSMSGGVTQWQAKGLPTVTGP
ncbi:MAG: rhodanese-like domain-containing protein [Anaerolineaceae bacterium]